MTTGLPGNRNPHLARKEKTADMADGNKQDRPRTWGLAIVGLATSAFNLAAELIRIVSGHG